MLKFLPAIVLLQAFTVALVLLAPELSGWAWLRLTVPLLIASVLAAAWLHSIATHQHRDEISRLKECHAQEREKLRVNAERAKQRVLKEAHQETMQEVRRTSTQANIKVGIAFAGAAGIAGLLLLTQFMTLGLLVLAATGGAASGYLLRWRQEKGNALLPNNAPSRPRLVNAKPSRAKLSAPAE
ncbi:MAG: hypothetical protein ACK4RS_03220 [Thiothrix sp.]